MVILGVALLNAVSAPLRAEVVSFDPTPSIGFNGTNEFFVEDGVHVEAFWADANSGSFVGGHFHIGPGSTGNAEFQHFNSESELQGFFIERADLSPFSLTSLDFLVTDTTSIGGNSPSDVRIWLAPSFDPSFSFPHQFSSLSADFFSGGSGAGTLDLTVLPSLGFGNVTRVFITSTASVRFDNIVIDDPLVAPVPEPASITLVGMGAFGMIGAILRRRRMKRE